jgi:hypothetical protein
MENEITYSEAFYFAYAYVVACGVRLCSTSRFSAPRPNRASAIAL